MFSLLFRNRWFAVGYVVLTVASASLFVGTDGGADKLAQTTKQLQAQRAIYAQESARLPAAPVAQPLPPSTPEPMSVLPLLHALSGSNADPANPNVGDVFINPTTGERVRAVKREDAGKYQPAFPGPGYSSSAASP